MRGALGHGRWTEGRQGITPAYAGSTGLTVTSRQRERDHPRVCGEHLIYFAFQAVVPGSPPRMRGALPFPSTVSFVYGITPAYAGSTALLYDRFQEIRDHPRVCGEHAVPSAWPEDNSGSPPRMRGAPVSITDGNRDEGITPAYAGSTNVTYAEQKAEWDHPRVCGEH